MANNIVSGGDGRVEFLCGGTITAGDFCVLSSGTAVTGTDGGKCIGVAVETYATGERGVFITGDGQTIVRTAAASGYDPGPGDVVYLASATTVDGGSSTNFSVGVIVTTDPSEAGVCEILLHTPGVTEITTHA